MLGFKSCRCLGWCISLNAMGTGLLGCRSLYIHFNVTASRDLCWLVFSNFNLLVWIFWHDSRFKSWKIRNFNKVFFLSFKRKGISDLVVQNWFYHQINFKYNKIIRNIMDVFLKIYYFFLIQTSKHIAYIAGSILNQFLMWKKMQYEYVFMSSFKLRNKEMLFIIYKIN